MESGGASVFCDSFSRASGIEDELGRGSAGALAEGVNGVSEIGPLEPALAGESVTAVQNAVILEQERIPRVQDHALGLERIEQRPELGDRGPRLFGLRTIGRLYGVGLDGDASDSLRVIPTRLARSRRRFISKLEGAGWRKIGFFSDRTRAAGRRFQNPVQRQYRGGSAGLVSQAEQQETAWRKARRQKCRVGMAGERRTPCAGRNVLQSRPPA